MARLLTYVAAGVLMTTGAQATPRLVDAVQLQAAIARLETAGLADGSGVAIAAVGKLLDLPAVVLPKMPTVAAAAPTGKVKIVMGDLQIAITQLSITEGTNNLLRVQRAQGNRRDAIFVSGGMTNLRDLATAVAAQGIDGLRVTDGVVHLTRPLVIWQGAGLALQPSDKLLIEAAGGGFLLSFGDLSFRGAEVSSDVAAASADTMYRPFLLIAGAGTIRAEDSYFTGLGMAGLGAFSGMVIANRGLFAPAFPVVLRANHFEDIGGLALIGARDATVDGNTFAKVRGNALALGETRDGVVVGNVISGTKGGAGLKVTDGVRGLQIAGNLVVGGAGNGLLINGNSTGVTISGNAILGNAETGIAAKAVDCLSVAGNIIADNGAGGLRVAQTGFTRISENALVANGSSAIAVSQKQPAANLELRDNLLAQNQVGLTGLQLTSVSLNGNDLSDQLPRLFDGEFAQHQAAYLTAGQQDASQTFQISATSAIQTADFATLCGKE
ncbi:MAG: right-handed parallel beta-helix repeat-containing protein [Paracoccaceae bacterium]